MPRISEQIHIDLGIKDLDETEAVFDFENSTMMKSFDFKNFDRDDDCLRKPK